MARLGAWCGNRFAMAVFLWFLYLVEAFLHSRVLFTIGTIPFQGESWTYRLLWKDNFILWRPALNTQSPEFFFIIHLQNHIFLTRMLQKSIRILTDLECKRCAKSQSTSSMFVLWRCDGTIFYDLSHHSGSMPHSKPRDFPPERTVSSVSYNLLIQDLLRAMTPMAIKTSSLRQDCHRAKRWASQSKREDEVSICQVLHLNSL